MVGEYSIIFIKIATFTATVKSLYLMKLCWSSDQTYQNINLCKQIRSASIPCGNGNNLSSYVILTKLPQIGQQRASGEHGADLARDVGADGVHQQVVAGIGLLPQTLDGARGHREGRDPRRTDHRVDALILRQEEIQQLRGEHAARGVQHEGYKPHRDYHESIHVDEFFTRHRRGDRKAQEYRHDVGEFVLRGVGEAVGDAADAQQVAEHDKTEQRDGGGGDDAAENGYEYREEYQHAA